jgi:23S rRNA (uracil1939-C5)-methyltransferase
MRKKIKIKDLEITKYAAQGKAIGKTEGKVIFVEGAVPGDIADVQISKNKKDWAEGKVTAIKKFSEDRIEPFCRHFGICGGCKWQMLPYEKQLEYKQQETEDTFQRIGKITGTPVLPILGSDNIIHYRNKLEFTFSDRKFLTSEELKNLRQDEWPGGALGYHVPRLYDKVIDVYECWLMDKVNDDIRNAIRDFAIMNQYSFYNIKDHTGWLRNIIVRFCSTKELMVNIVFGYEDKKETEKLCNFLLTTVPCITTLIYTINPKWNDSIFDLEYNVVHGKGYVMEKLGRFHFKISPKSFFQTNTKQAEKLYDTVKNFAGLNGTQVIYDLYCGTGSIGIYLSDGAKEIIGVDVIPEAITDAIGNASRNQVSQATFFCGDVIEVCNEAFFKEHGKADIIIVDPPRAGLHEKLIKKIIEIAPQKIVYVSCNIATQARDLSLFKEYYTVDKLQPVDMFPHTHHIESVALLSLGTSMFIASTKA